MLGFLLQIQTGAIQDTVQDSIDRVSQVVTQAAPVVTEQSMSLLDLLIKGGVVMIPILLLSLLAFYFFFERLIAIRKAAKKNTSFMNNISNMILNMKIEEAKILCSATNTPVSRMISKGIERFGKPINEIEKSVESVGKFEISKLEKNMKILGIVAGIAPMLGFIGTIIGVIKIFYNISLADNISIGLIAGGLYEKMITSASGLIIGVIAYAGYHYLNILLDKVIFNMEDSAIEFMDLLQKKG
ncbi:MAG: biopolymer transporter ExbB [Bacteroidetes bacterium RIFOXYA12_FULL_35_11]|nr:MAG: biopolymer transporter ExbB [Bacteroidetes bacterium GWF2_35_48]OFY82549.1 MAG: biopolymer transporter ExbB [Bacteroidetes bacterium RIFOXYA12_FULL_35_11]OFY93560.1 MAG: biopolymer transporter ExbB [Bacteroidetes bacterium RIFOXYC12_FULL_35_7]HBX52828.1 biopolymer transporter ExbB [Bacteroidales bacterium]